MNRSVIVAAAQMGPIQIGTSRGETVARIMDLLAQAKSRSAEMVVLPELALTTFFPRFEMSEAEIDAHCETEMPGPETQPIFDFAKENRITIYLGYAELIPGPPKKRFNTAILIGRDGKIAMKYRKVHLPGYSEPQSDVPFQHLELGYFDVGDLGFPVRRVDDANIGMCICNDRRWPETFRVLGLQNVELALCGYNTSAVNYHGNEPSHLKMFHHLLVLQAAAYQNSTYVVATGKTGVENGQRLIAGSCIVAPTGEVLALSQTDGDEVITAHCDLERCRFGKETMFNFARYRQPEHYRLIVDRVGAKDPE